MRDVDGQLVSGTNFSTHDNRSRIHLGHARPHSSCYSNDSANRHFPNCLEGSNHPPDIQFLPPSPMTNSQLFWVNVNTPSSRFSFPKKRKKKDVALPPGFFSANFHSHASHNAFFSSSMAEKWRKSSGRDDMVMDARAVEGRKGAQGMAKSHHPQECYLGYAERMMTCITHRGALEDVTRG